MSPDTETDTVRTHHDQDTAVGLPVAAALVFLVLLSLGGMAVDSGAGVVSGQATVAGTAAAD